jgi:glucose dehydrogenase
MLPWAAAADQVFEWRHHGGTLKAQRYAPLDQIGRENVADLEVAWRWSARNFGPVPERNYITTPIMAGGRGPPV